MADGFTPGWPSRRERGRSRPCWYCPAPGFAARPRPLEHARHGYLAIDVQIHGQDVDLPKYPPLPGYYDRFQFEPVEAYYYYNVHLRVVQAVNYLASRPDVDARRIVAVGGSQGGRLSVVIAGLDRRIAAAVACIAEFAQLSAPALGRPLQRADKPGAVRRNKDR